MKILAIYYKSSFVIFWYTYLISNKIYSLKVKSSSLSEQKLLLIETNIFRFIEFNNYHVVNISSALITPKAECVNHLAIEAKKLIRKKKRRIEIKL